MDPPEFNGTMEYDWFKWLWRYDRRRLAGYFTQKNLDKLDSLRLELKETSSIRRHWKQKSKGKNIDEYVMRSMYQELRFNLYNAKQRALSEKFSRDFKQAQI